MNSVWTKICQPRTLLPKHILFAGVNTVKNKKGDQTFTLVMNFSTYLLFDFYISTNTQLRWARRLYYDTLLRLDKTTVYNSSIHLIFTNRSYQSNTPCLYREHRPNDRSRNFHSFIAHCGPLPNLSLRREILSPTFVGQIHFFYEKPIE